MFYHLKYRKYFAGLLRKVKRSCFGYSILSFLKSEPLETPSIWNLQQFLPIYGAFSEPYQPCYRSEFQGTNGQVEHTSDCRICDKQTSLQVYLQSGFSMIFCERPHAFLQRLQLMDIYCDCIYQTIPNSNSTSKHSAKIAHLSHGFRSAFQALNVMDLHTVYCHTLELHQAQLGFEDNAVSKQFDERTPSFQIHFEFAGNRFLKRASNSSMFPFLIHASRIFLLMAFSFPLLSIPVRAFALWAHARKNWLSGSPLVFAFKACIVANLNRLHDLSITIIGLRARNIYGL